MVYLSGAFGWAAIGLIWSTWKTGFGTTLSGGPSDSKARFKAPTLHGLPVIFSLRFWGERRLGLYTKDEGKIWSEDKGLNGAKKKWTRRVMGNA